jgi:hypothetical protein
MKERVSWHAVREMAGWLEWADPPQSENATPTLLPATPAPYLGGKRNLARRVVARLGAIPHTTYVEPFVPIR